MIQVLQTKKFWLNFVNADISHMSVGTSSELCLKLIHVLVCSMLSPTGTCLILMAGTECKVGLLCSMASTKMSW